MTSDKMLIRWFAVAIMLVIVFAVPAMAQLPYTPQINAAACYNATLGWIPIHAAVNTPLSYTPSVVGLAGQNGTNYYPLQCDSSGNLIVTPTDGAVEAGGPYNLTAYPAGTTTTIGPINVKTDSTGNNLYYPGFGDYTALVSSPSGGGAGHFRMYGITTQGFTRLNILNELGGQPTVLGRDNQFIVQNSLLSPINAGAVVYINGSTSSNIPTVGLAQANSLTTSPAVGLVYSTIGPGGYGYVMKIGILSNINTVALGATAGQSLFLSCTSAGSMTTTRPVAPCYAQKVATALYSSVSQGALDVVIQTSLGNHDSGTDQPTFSLPPGGTMSSRDTGTPGFIFGPDSITATQPVTAPNPIAASSLTITPIANPSAPSVAATCTGTCTTLYTYEIVLNTLSTSITTANSSPTSVNNQASLGALEYNTITAPSCPSGVNSWDLWRLAGGTNALGKITNAQACGSNVKDTGVAGDTSTPPSTNITGGLYITGLKSPSGNYFLCINSSGNVGAYSSPCNED